MASIKISNLPELTSDNLTDDDQFVINDANQTTSRLSYADFKTNFLTSNLTFAGSVDFSGDVTVDVNSTNTNVATKEGVAILITESEARTGLLIQDNSIDITRLVSLTKAPSVGGIYTSGTFVGAASSATNLVDAINAVSTTQEDNQGVISTLQVLVGNNTSAITSNTNSIATLNNEVDVVEADIVTLKSDVTAIQNELSALSTVVGNSTDGLVSDITSLSGRVTTLEGKVDVIETTLATGGAIKTEIEAAQTTATEANSFATSNNIEYRSLLAKTGTDIAAKTAAAVNAGTLTAESLSQIITDAIADALSGENHSGV